MSNNGIVSSKTGVATSKAKASLGVPSSHVIVWVPFNLSPQDNALLKAYVKAETFNVMKKESQPVHLFGRDILVSWFHDNREEIEEKAEAFLQETEKSTEDLQKELERVARLAARLQEQLAAKSQK